MSDNWIIVVPEEPSFMPPPDGQQKAVSLFQSIASAADDFEVVATQEVRFIDCGCNFEGVFCPDCGGELDVEWWQDAKSEEFDAGFPLKEATLPCCGVSHSLAALRYEWPQAFARFSIGAMNAQIADLSDEQMRSFESALGCRVRKVLRHL